MSVPVVIISPTGFDVMHALTKARREGASVALVTHGDTPAEIRRFLSAYGIDVICESYRSAQDAENLVLDLRDRRVDVVVGPGLVADLAADAGMSSVFLYSRTSVAAAFDTALEVAHAMRREAARRDRLDNLLQHLRDGVVAVDAAGCIEAINRRLADALGIADPSRAVGQALLDVAPKLDGVLPAADGDVFGAVRGVSYAIHRGPLASDGASGGTIFTFQESRAVERLDRSLRSRRGAQEFAARYRLEDVVGESEPIERVRALVRRYAKSDATVLILGESGTGKEMVAQSMHRLSRRKDFPFVAMNCGAFPEALLESEALRLRGRGVHRCAQGRQSGVDRGGASRHVVSRRNRRDAALAAKPAVARAAGKRSHPPRIDGADARGYPRDCRDASHARRRRRERIVSGRSFYRINILSIAVPPLRARSGDIVPLAAALLLQAARRDRALALRVPSREAALRVLAPLAPALCDYPWPGNVRELQNVVERIAVEISDMETDGDRPVALTSNELRAIAPELFDVRRESNVDRSLRDLSRSVEADQVRASLAAFGGDRDAVCKALGISKTTLWRRLNTKGLD